mgnify:CR=1 FL=1
MHQVAAHEDVALRAAVVEVDFVAMGFKNAEHFISAEHGVYLLSFRMVLLYSKKCGKSNLKLSVKQIEIGY